KMAFQKAVAIGHRVIVAEMQGGDKDHCGDERSVVARAANNAFRAGAVVIAANGNYGDGVTPGSVKAPAVARNVIGVGAFDIVTGAQCRDQGLGPGSGGRIKPDIQAPTGAQTVAGLHTDTSGATPFAAGAAVLLRNFLLGTSGSIDPGQVYAFLI